MAIETLNDRFGIPGTVEFDAHPGGLERARVRTPDGAEATIYLLGAHVTHWRPPDAEPVLWLSECSAFVPGRPIRGGVPVCHPWFAARPGDPGAPLHGFVRLMPWNVASVAANDDGTVCLTFQVRFEQGSAGWPGRFELHHRITVGRTLTMELTTTNRGPEPLTITEALHTYFRVSDVRSVSVTGLEGRPYFCKVTGRDDCLQGDEPITFRGETDRVFQRCPAGCVLHDPGLGRDIHIAKRGSGSTVLWNPWVEKARAMEDFGDDEWPGMLCIETANALADAVTIAPGAAHTLAAHISLQPPDEPWGRLPEADAPAALPSPGPAEPARPGPADATQCIASIHLRAAPPAVFEAWATAAGLKRWLLADAEFRPPDAPTPRPDGAARSGDAFRWTWPLTGRTVEGTVAECLWPERLALSPGPGGRCEVTLRPEAGGTTVELRLADLPDPAAAEARRAWTFHLTNLKSVLEHDADLRETDPARRGAVNA